LRAIAILGVVLGHWLVTAFVATNGQLQVVSPLTSLPALTPVSWLFQPLAVFFLVGGYAGAKSLDSANRAGRPYHSWLAARMSRLGRPVLVVLVFWAVAGRALAAAGISDDTLHTLRWLVSSPLWFVAVYAALNALTPLVLAAWQRWRGYAVVAPLLVVALVDVCRFDLGLPDQVGWLNLVAGWLVPYTLGVAWARGALTHRATPPALLVGGALVAVALVHWGGYPASMVGVPGEGRSNLNPPTLAAVTFGLAQVGLALLLRGPLTRWAHRPLAWTGIVAVNLSAMTVFVWHQTALIAVTTFCLGYGQLPGLHTPPGQPWWILDRLAWLPIFAAALAMFVALFRRFERP
jgi:hypothetical protein